MYILWVRSTGEDPDLELVSDVGGGGVSWDWALTLAVCRLFFSGSDSARTEWNLRLPAGVGEAWWRTPPHPRDWDGSPPAPQRCYLPVLVTAAAFSTPGQAFLWFLGFISYWYLFFICFGIFNITILNPWPIHFNNSDSDYNIVCFRVVTSPSFCVNFKRQNSFSSKPCHISILFIYQPLL